MMRESRPGNLELRIPLKNLRFSNGTVYAGLVHYTHGVEGSLKRLATFKRHYSGPTGVATECGLPVRREAPSARPRETPRNSRGFKLTGWILSPIRRADLLRHTGSRGQAPYR